MSQQGRQARRVALALALVLGTTACSKEGQGQPSDGGSGGTGGSTDASSEAGVGGGTTGSGGAATGMGGATTSTGGATTSTGGATTSTGGATTSSGGAVGTGGMAGVIGSGGRSATGGGASGQGAAGGANSGGGGNHPGSAGAAGSANAGGASGGGGHTATLPSTSLAVRFADAILAKWPDPRDISANTSFEYNNGIVLHGLERVYAGTRDRRYLTYIQRYIDDFVDASGKITRPTAHSFDTMQPAILLPFLFQELGSNKYQLAAANMRAVYDTIPRNAAGGFWHKQTYPNQMWLDSIYMGEPFLARYGTAFGTCGTFCADTAVEQITLLATHVRDASTGLLVHAWDQSGMATWAATTTGRSPEVWGRALGWYAMALVDILPDLPAGHAGRAPLLDLLGGIATALRATQTSNGLWYQVVDKGTRSDNWQETSASGMFVYALKVAVDHGYIDSSFMAQATLGWQGLMTQVTSDSAGRPLINGAVAGMGVQDDYANYVNKTRLSNSSHGLCAILMAASAMEAR